MSYLKEFLHVVVIFTLINTVLYLAGVFIAWDWNVMNWLMIKDWQGRFFITVIELAVILPLSGKLMQVTIEEFDE